MKALVIGATGATGKDLVNMLLQDTAYTEVVVFVRRPSEITNPKLSEILTDFDKLEEVAGSIQGDVWFSCLGTTLKDAGSKEKQWHIDYTIPANFAELAKKNGIPKAVLLSAYGASPSSSVFYSKMKGELEEKIASLAFEQYVIFKPGMLLRKNTDRPSERIIANVLHFVNKLGIIRKFRPLATSVLAEKMAKAPKVLPSGKHSIELNKIFEF
ncbi:NAD(P)H-binding protein [Cytophagaceae bacterium DM2B3-1]|uniref:NAD(P)H-binding protein n=1 Tax=Xanthocytophaga flava TaxID=3048013 RepID=A0ABT7CE19_9BACT|nr:NAD(P)H-binding protein [Xanthocytophaga flavus]MDJ1472722.1 NAD(P)H-binding protein [Xanthocytophaga flavus]MDJ1491903.1 NAD(P)H-binding protein [Xanthocytophaga flavus]